MAISLKSPCPGAPKKIFGTITLPIPALTKESPLANVSTSAMQLGLKPASWNARSSTLRTALGRVGSTRGT
ncbi:hypothetical protein ACVIM7_008622 [Bradyrhizobium liaoningense]